MDSHGKDTLRWALSLPDHKAGHVPLLYCCWSSPSFPSPSFPVKRRENRKRSLLLVASWVPTDSSREAKKAQQPRSCCLISKRPSPQMPTSPILHHNPVDLGPNSGVQSWNVREDRSIIWKGLDIWASAQTFLQALNELHWIDSILDEAGYKLREKFSF